MRVTLRASSAPSPSVSSLHTVLVIIKVVGQERGGSETVHFVVSHVYVQLNLVLSSLDGFSAFQGMKCSQYIVPLASYNLRSLACHLA